MRHYFEDNAAKFAAKLQHFLRMAKKNTKKITLPDKIGGNNRLFLDKIGGNRSPTGIWRILTQLFDQCHALFFYLTMAESDFFCTFAKFLTTMTSMKYTIRHTTFDDIPVCMSLFDAARAIMRSSGNMTQWNNGYPSRDVLENDIRNSNSYVICHENGMPIATFACIVGEDPTYKIIENGEWLHPELAYATIHRLASTPDTHDIARITFDFAQTLAPSLRVDTHADNIIMQHILDQYGFSKRGIIHLANGDPRIAYQYFG